jgi:hypothetical protein
MYPTPFADPTRGGASQHLPGLQTGFPDADGASTPSVHADSMKPSHPYRRLRLTGLAALGVSLLGSALQAAPFLYAPGDLLLTFRQSGNANDLVVNLGPAKALSELAAGSTLTLTRLNPDQLNAAFPSVNELAWSVSAANRPPLVVGFPLQTLWLTAPRLDPAVQSPPWLRKGQFGQATAASQVDAIGVNAAASSSSQSAGPNNTATAVTIPVATDFAASPLLGPGGDFVSTFQGSVENVTASDFDGAPENLSRSDLYELLPGSTAAGTLDKPGRLLGYFELKPDGTLTFQNSAPPPARPRITAVTRDGDVATVTFQSTSGATYRLRSTDAAGLTTPFNTWTPGASVTASGAAASLTETSTAEVRFFAVEALP